MVVHVISLKPDMELAGRILSLKSRARAAVGDQQYLADSPHLTLYLADFPDTTAVIENLRLVIEAVSSYNHGVDITDWLLFKNDPVTGKHTIALDIGSDGVSSLRKIQKKIVLSLNGVRSPTIPERYRTLESLGSPEKHNLERYGFPFVGDVWKPHFTVASFEPEAFDKAWRSLKPHCPKGFYTISHLSVSQIRGGSGTLVSIRDFPLSE